MARPYKKQEKEKEKEKMYCKELYIFNLLFNNTIVTSTDTPR